MRASVVVVGAGIIGCSIARELASRGIRCTVIDERGVAAGATQASAGMLAPYVEAHEPGPLLDLGVRSLRLYPEWMAAVRRESNIDVEFESIGTLQVAATAQRARELQAESATHGRWLGPGDLAGAHPQLATSFGGRFVAEHGYVVPPQLANALAQAAERHGTTFRAGRVDRMSRAASGYRVDTSAGPIAADAIVLAAGAWANSIEGLTTPPVRPIRGQIVQLAWPGQMLASIIWGPRCYIVPRLDRTILVGATAEDVGYDERATAAGVRDLLAAACELLPEAQDASFLDVRVGLRPATPDGLPAIGEDPEHAGIFHASGHYRNGVLLAPITARLIGDLVADGRRDECLDRFRVDRFR